MTPALDDILQFPDIARPVMVFERTHHVFGNSVDRLTLLLANFSTKCSTSGRISSRRSRSGGKRHREDVQSVIEIGPELTLLNQPSQILVRSRDDSHIDLDRMTASEPLELLFLERAQKFRL